MHQAWSLPDVEMFWQDGPEIALAVREHFLAGKSTGLWPRWLAMPPFAWCQCLMLFQLTLNAWTLRPARGKDSRSCTYPVPEHSTAWGSNRSSGENVGNGGRRIFDQVSCK